jgi:hypothetical protein
MTLNEIIFWLTDPIRAGLPRALGDAARLHGLLTVLAAGVLLPLAVLLARYFKVLPGQDWPRQLDRRVWWVAHLGLAYGAALTLLAGMVIILREMSGSADDGEGAVAHLAHAHAWLGWLSLAMMVALFINGWQRGSVGGPGKPAPGTLGPLHGVAGDHYDMTARRRWFERTHKLLGFLLLAVLIGCVISGLWHVNAPRGALVFLAAWWLLLLLLALRWERQGRCVDGYQAKWGPAMAHPGNRIPELGWGTRRYTEEEFNRLAWARRPMQGRKARRNQEMDRPAV